MLGRAEAFGDGVMRFSPDLTTSRARRCVVPVLLDAADDMLLGKVSTCPRSQRLERSNRADKSPTPSYN
jgi:hypothetical protein